MLFLDRVSSDEFDQCGSEPRIRSPGRGLLVLVVLVGFRYEQLRYTRLDRSVVCAITGRDCAITGRDCAITGRDCDYWSRLRLLVETAQLLVETAQLLVETAQLLVENT